MKFGVILDPHIETWDLIRYAEDLGYTHVRKVFRDVAELVVPALR